MRKTKSFEKSVNKSNGGTEKDSRWQECFFGTKPLVLVSATDIFLASSPFLLFSQVS